MAIVMLATARTAKQILEELQTRAGGSAGGIVRLASSPQAERARTLAPPRPTGVAALDDAIAGGLPRGRLVELVGRASAGRMSIVVSALAAATARGEVAALIDAADGFDPASAAGAGVALERVLWVRPASIADALRAADLVLDAGGFGVVVLYLAGARQVTPSARATQPLRAGGVTTLGAIAGFRARERKRGVEATDSAWARLAHMAERARASVLVACERSLCGTFAAATVELTARAAKWQRAPGGDRLLCARELALSVTRSKLGPPAFARVVIFTGVSR